MKGEVHRTTEVRAHYAGLASHYDEKANKACKRAYLKLIQRTLDECCRVLEIGAGSSPSLEGLSADVAIACDLSLPMLATRHAAPDAPRVVADGQCLPFCDRSFDGVFCVNVLEHAPDPVALVAEAARVLAPGGVLLAITPNGDVAWLLDLLETLRLKLPEGPHRFITHAGLTALAGPGWELLECRAFLAFPTGPEVLVETIDRIASRTGQWGLFHYAVMRRV